MFNLVEFIFTERYLKAAEFDRLDNDPGEMDNDTGTAAERTRCDVKVIQLETETRFLLKLWHAKAQRRRIPGCSRKTGTSSSEILGFHTQGVGVLHDLHH